MRIRAAVSLLALAASLVAQTPPGEQAAKPVAPAQEPRIAVQVNLVNLLVSALDAEGRPMADLDRDAFEVLEEGVAQRIELFERETTQPLDLALMVDSSLSTFKELAFEREAAAHFIRQVVRPGDRLAVYQFSETVMQLAGFSADVAALQAAVRGIEPGASTAMYDAIYLGSQGLGKRPTGRRRVIVLVTDAGETTSETSFETARRAALRADCLVYTVLIRPVKNEGGRNTAGEHALITIADVTGGALYPADEPTELDRIFERIDRELRTQYRLGYYPSPRPPQRSFRRVEVRVKDAAMLRYRKGYYTPGAVD